MAFNADYFLKKTLGEDFQDLFKSEIYHPNSRSTSDVSDIIHGLQIVPRVVMAFLIKELTPMSIGEHKEIDMPIPNGSQIQITKIDRNAYSGQLLQNNKKIADFVSRTIPSLGIIIMTSYELYDVDNLIKEDEVKPSEDISLKVQKIIDERLELHDLINKVVDKKISEKDAIHQLLLMKLTEELQKEKEKNKQIAEIRKIQEQTTPQSDPYFRGMTNGIEVINSVVNNTEPNFVNPIKKGSPLKDFLEKRKIKNKEFDIRLTKGEDIDCPDCGSNIFNDTGIHTCVCYGEDIDRKIFLKKTEDGIKVSFPKKWSAENIEMLLSVLRGKRG